MTARAMAGGRLGEHVVLHSKRGREALESRSSGDTGGKQTGPTPKHTHDISGRKATEENGIGGEQRRAGEEHQRREEHARRAGQST